jgi:hypothetical protein
MEYLLACPRFEGLALDAAVEQVDASGKTIPWAFEEWRLSAIPKWRAKLRRSLEDEDRQAEMEARWMLEVLMS